MRTMYKVEERVYTNDIGREGKYTEWANRKGFFETIEEAREIAKTIKPNLSTGDWKIVEITIDEETFTIKENKIENFNYWEEEIKNRKKILSSLTK